MKKKFLQEIRKEKPSRKILCVIKFQWMMKTQNVIVVVVRKIQCLNENVKYNIIKTEKKKGENLLLLYSHFCFKRNIEKN